MPYIYYSRENAAGNCGVDRIDVSQTEPTSFQDSGTMYSQKFDFGDKKAFIGQIKVRSYTTSTQTIKVYISVDG